MLKLTLAAAAGSDLGLSLVPLFNPSHQSIETESNVKIGERALIMGGPTLATNLLSTGLIAWKAWCVSRIRPPRAISDPCRWHRNRRVSVGKHLYGGSGSLRVDRVFALLIESGFIYCCIWVCAPFILADGFAELFQILYVISAFQVMSNLGFIVMDAVLLFISVSSATLHIFLSTEYWANIGPISHAHSHSRCRAEEPSRTLLDPLESADANIRTSGE